MCRSRPSATGTTPAPSGSRSRPAPTRRTGGWWARRLGSVVPERLSSEELRTVRPGHHVSGAHRPARPLPLSGPGVHHCPVCLGRHRRSRAPNPADFGKKVFGFFHEEFHGGAAPGNQFCDAAHSASEAENCWMSATVFNVSTDGGRCYAPVSVSGNTCVFSPAESRPPSQRVTSLPDRYANNWGRRGLGAPTNVVYDSVHDYFYFFVRSPSIDPASPAPWSDEVMPAYRDQQPGECLVRTHDISDPSSWRAWDGEGNSAWDADGFSVRFIDPYTEAQLPARHRCQPVAADVIGALTTSLTYNTVLRHVHADRAPALRRRDVRPGSLLLAVRAISSTGASPRRWRTTTKDVQAHIPIVYPSIHRRRRSWHPFPTASGPRNFDHPGQQSAFLYYSRTCRGSVCSGQRSRARTDHLHLVAGRPGVRAGEQALHAG